MQCRGITDAPIMLSNAPRVKVAQNGAVAPNGQEAMRNAGLARRIASPLGHIAVLATRRMEVVQIEPDGVPVFATQKSFRRRYRCGDTNIKCRPVRQKSSRQLSGRSRRASKSKRRQRC